MRNPDNAVGHLLKALSRIDSHQWPDLGHPVQEEFLAEVSEMWGLTIDRDDLESSLAPIGPLSRMVAAWLPRAAPTTSPRRCCQPGTRSTLCRLGPAPRLTPASFPGLKRR